MSLLSEGFMLPKVGLRAKLLDEQEGTSNGEWLNIQGYERSSIHVVLGGTGTVQVRASNEEAPVATDDGGLVEEVSASSFVQLRAPARWLKAKVTANNNKISAFVEAVP